MRILKILAIMFLSAALCWTVMVLSLPFAWSLGDRIANKVDPDGMTLAEWRDGVQVNTSSATAGATEVSTLQTAPEEKSFDTSEAMISMLLREYDEQLATLDDNKWGLLYYFDEYHVRCETTGEFCETEDADPMQADITLEMHEGKYSADAGSFLIFDVTNPALADAKMESYRINGTYAISLKGDNDKDWNDTFEVTCTNALTFKCEKYGLDDDIASMLCRNNSVDVELYSFNAKSGRSVLSFTIPCSDFTGVWERYKDTLTTEE